VPEARILRDGYCRAGSRARPRRDRAGCDAAFAIVSRSCRGMRHRFEHRWRRRSNGSLFRIELTGEQDRAPITSARSQAASSAIGPCGLASRMMPGQERSPCPGWLRSRRITSTGVAVRGPIFAAPVFVGPGFRWPRFSAARATIRNNTDGWPACDRRWWYAGGWTMSWHGRRHVCHGGRSRPSGR